ncbi:MAG TPA: hypothetical protein VL961_06450, partial [Acidimicrobiales bacterium]|nr:hypothetical protein [Acidimicrobiales bacterium]
VVYQTSSPAKVLGSIAPSMIRSVLRKYVAVTAGSTAWASSGAGHYERTEPLDAFTRRVSPIGVRSAVGEVREKAVVQKGYLTSVDLYIVVPNQTLPGGQQAPGGIAEENYQLLGINGTSPSKL